MSRNSRLDTGRGFWGSAGIIAWRESGIASGAYRLLPRTLPIGTALLNPDRDEQREKQAAL